MSREIKIRSRFLLFFILLGIGLFNHSSRVLAQDSPVPNEPGQLWLLIDQARLRNPEIIAATKKLEALQQEIQQEKAWEDPEFTLTQYEAPSNLDLSHPAQTWYGLGQSFSFPGKRALKGKIAEKEAEYQYEMLQTTIREVVFKLKSAYYRQFFASKGINIHLAHQTLLEEFTRSAQQKYAAGFGSQQEIVKAEVELSKLHNSLLALEEDKIEAETTLNAILNQPADVFLETSEEPENTEFKHTLEELIPSALKNRPELLAANLQIQKKGISLSLAEKYIYPDFMAELTYMESHKGEENKWMAIAKMNLPWIFNHKYQAKIRQIRLEKEETEAELKGIENKTLAELRILHSKIKSLEKSLNMYRNGILPQAEQSLKASQIAYQSGKTDLLNVIDSERTLKDLEMNYFETLVDFNQRISELEKLTGKDLN
ncbi:MAG: TolC family protein [Nitrospirae bacterium]|nr:TolC family protein [Nitrospirota bacterium]